MQDPIPSSKQKRKGPLSPLGPILAPGVRDQSRGRAVKDARTEDGRERGSLVMLPVIRLNASPKDLVRLPGAVAHHLI